MAAQNGHPAAVQLLLESKAEVDTRCKVGTRQRIVDCTFKTLYESAVTGSNDNQELSAHHRRRCCHTICLFLHVTHPDCSAKSCWQNQATPLICATFGGDLESMQLLLQAKADVGACRYVSERALLIPI
jgi:hypothetical protein